jgi:hypothetical protein
MTFEQAAAVPTSADLSGSPGLEDLNPGHDRMADHQEGGDC